MRGTVAPPVPLVGVTLVSVALAPVARAAHRDDADGTTRAVTPPRGLSGRPTPKDSPRGPPDPPAWSPGSVRSRSSRRASR
jgi:hypothetical protein